MLLTISTTYQPATDLGHLLHKNPAKAHSFEMSFGKAHLFYPEATRERCTAALLLDIDAVGLVRGKRCPGEGGTLEQYVNDRPYVLSSFTSVALGRIFGTAMTGRKQEPSGARGTEDSADGGFECSGVSSRQSATGTLRASRISSTGKRASPGREISGVGR
jgi:hypothetical protein